MAKKPTYEELAQKAADLEKQVAELQQLPDYPQIVRGSPIPTFVIDRRHSITHCNRAFENLTGIAAHELIGTRKQWLAFYPAQRPVMADLIVDNASAEELTRYYGRNYWKSPVTEEGYEAEGYFPDLGAKGKWLYFTAAPLKDEEGRITGASADNTVGNAISRMNRKPISASRWIAPSVTAFVGGFSLPWMFSPQNSC